VLKQTEDMELELLDSDPLDVDGRRLIAIRVTKVTRSSSPRFPKMPSKWKVTRLAKFCPARNNT